MLFRSYQEPPKAAALRFVTSHHATCWTDTGARQMHQTNFSPKHHWLSLELKQQYAQHNAALAAVSSERAFLEEAELLCKSA